MGIVISCGDYYSKFRDLCHGLKLNDSVAISDAAAILVDRIPNGVVLVPAPSRLGYSTVALSVCQRVSELNLSVRVSDCVAGRSRESLYSLKKRSIKTVPMGFYMKKSTPTKNAFLFDGVVDTGETFRQLARCTGISRMMCLATT